MERKTHTSDSLRELGENGHAAPVAPVAGLVARPLLVRYSARKASITPSLKQLQHYIAREVSLKSVSETN